MSRIDELKKLSDAGTEGPWRTDMQAMGRYEVYQESSLPEQKFIAEPDVYADAELIAAMRNSFDDLLVVAEAAKEFYEIVWAYGKQGDDYSRVFMNMKEALKNLEEK